MKDNASFVVRGHGSSACVVAPALALVGNSQRWPMKQRYGTVAKLFFENGEAERELALLRILSRDIDPSGTYTTKYLGRGLPDARELAAVQSIHPAVSHHQMQIILEDGGYSLDKIITKKSTVHIDILLLLQGLRHIAQGLQRFREKGWIHGDIKPANVLYEPNKHKFSITDMGLMFQYKDMVSDKSHRHWIYQQKYEIWPPELLLLRWIEHGANAGRLAKAVDEAVSLWQIDNYTSEQEMAAKKIYAYHYGERGIMHYKQLLALTIKTFDIYGLGYTILRLVKKYKPLVHERRTLARLRRLGREMTQPHPSARPRLSEVDLRLLGIMQGSIKKNGTVTSIR